MTSFPQDRCRNLLLRRMPADAFALLAPHLQPMPAQRGDVLFRAREPAGHVFFLEKGIISTVAVSPEGLRVEAGLLGREGFGPVVAALDDNRPPFDGNIQLPGDGHRIATGPFRAAMDRSGGLRALMHKFAHTLGVQAAYTALSNAVHPIDERLARWILMVHDRSDDDELALTHEFMAVMLAVRRPSVTTALHVLEGNGFIRAERGLVVVRDRAGLQAFAGDAYGAPEQEYERLLGPMK